MNTDMDIDINTVTDTITCRLVEPGTDRISPGMETQWQQTHSLDLPRRRSSIKSCRMVPGTKP